jgi:hypothetical protein
VVDVADIALHFLDDQNFPICDVESANLQWSFTKKRDWVTKQILSCGSITLTQTGADPDYAGFPELLLPLERCTGIKRVDSMGVDGGPPPEGDPTSSIPNPSNLPSPPELLYTSFSKPTGDNVKSL